ncbi:hypothetical protein VZT92_025081 [Zoarces viviparus]|uniref:Uncharacterized protein n=1 Tax=Zoarces viviparus TaxID=48416 RepID=A0AAW1E4P4_ZOAVI
MHRNPAETPPAPTPLTPCTRRSSAPTLGGARAPADCCTQLLFLLVPVPRLFALPRHSSPSFGLVTVATDSTFSCGPSPCPGIVHHTSVHIACAHAPPPRQCGRDGLVVHLTPGAGIPPQPTCAGPHFHCATRFCSPSDSRMR